MLASTLIAGKPTLLYAEIQTIMARAANIINDRPIGVQNLTETTVQVIMPNKLLFWENVYIHR